MEILNKKISDITFEDVEELVYKIKPEENEFLDYKRQFENDNIVKLVSALANTYGGWIIIGVDTEKENNKPKEIVSVEDAKLEDRLHSICWDSISPPVLAFQCRYVENETKNKRVFVIWVEESDMTPHAVEYGTTVYIKVKAQKRSISRDSCKKADLDHIDWLKNRRQRYVEMGLHLQNKTKGRFEGAYGECEEGSPITKFSLIPKYAKDKIVEPHQLLDFLKAFRYRYVANGKQQSILNYEFHTASDCIIFVQENSEYSFLNYSEVNCYGQYASLNLFKPHDAFYDYGWFHFFNQQFNEYWVNLEVILKRLYKDLTIGTEILNKYGYRGHVLLTCTFSELRNRRLKLEYFGSTLYMGNISIKSKLEDSYEYCREHEFAELCSKREEVFGEIVDEMLFSFDCGLDYRKGIGIELAKFLEAKLNK